MPEPCHHQQCCPLHTGTPAVRGDAWHTTCYTLPLPWHTYATLAATLCIMMYTAVPAILCMVTLMPPLPILTLVLQDSHIKKDQTIASLKDQVGVCMRCLSAPGYPGQLPQTVLYPTSTMCLQNLRGKRVGFSLHARFLIDLSPVGTIDLLILHILVCLPAAGPGLYQDPER
jgi:hypothetical protein